MGISDSGLDSLIPKNLGIVARAGFIAGGERHLEFVSKIKAEKFAFKSNLSELAEKLTLQLSLREEAPIVVLASGDPLFFGIGKYLADKLGADKLEICPNLSSLQTAFARVGLSWEDAALVSVHGRPISNLAAVPPDCLKVGVFTDDKNTPSEVAASLIAQGWPADSEAWVLENLDNAEEKRTALPLGEIRGQAFGPLNVLLCKRSEPMDPRRAHAFGLPDAEFFQRKPEEGLLTKAEIRAVSLSKMRLHPKAVIWDVGAGSGSVSIEAARLARRGKVWAIEKNEEECENVRRNIDKFGTVHVSVLHGKAPEVLKDIPDDPDSVFIGGSAGKMFDILEACRLRLKPGGSLVVNTVTLENTAEAMEWYKASGLEWNFLQMQVSRGKPILNLNRLDALNPVFIISGYKKL